ncbi:cytochrome c oxidase subunit II [Gloeobacter kilaueensis]|uniref:Cytochrome c oxidase subunit 2 n=1 Tax=Gloeobacter kilaueensis (strain ATCC BAA-2537 / CCAP 1431/1 / ULC 316 / JS1) TaxID=1183438 RepID=U5QK52_GLOK1|nr:cytochrome c oxidase subunit II [Gloeobacter kilaueensis]AGY59273.1 cytochrome c oxidase subunit II [Gloeobacter kilaueensis JS1]
MPLKNLLIIAAIVAVDSALSVWVGSQSPGWLPVQATVEAGLIDELFRLLATIGAFIFFGIEGALLYSLLFSRAAKGDFSDAEPIEGNTRLEILWTAIPVVLVIYLGVYSFDIYKRMSILGPMQLVHLHLPGSSEPALAAAPPIAGKPDIVIEVMSRQWAWSFYYPDAGVTSSQLHLEAGRRVRLKLRSADVLHGFYVPEFRVKQDIVPARTIDMMFTPTRPGRYRLHDSQFSGTYYGANEADVIVDAPADYGRWLAGAAAGRQTGPLAQPPPVETQEPKRAFSSGWPVVPHVEPPIKRASPTGGK